MMMMSSPSPEHHHLARSKRPAAPLERALSFGHVPNGRRSTKSACTAARGSPDLVVDSGNPVLGLERQVCVFLTSTAPHQDGRSRFLGQFVAIFSPCHHARRVVFFIYLFFFFPSRFRIQCCRLRILHDNANRPVS